ncbi:MAG TPA: nuclease A inhibitor family protein [Gemmataceae bacterium]|nr:nuclease A inhibitor family protein [Gemmataceae bacterium]
MTKAIDDLTQAVKGLLYSSESEAELKPVTVEGSAIDAVAARKLAGAAKGVAVEEESLDDFFRTVPPEDKAKFAKVRNVLERLASVKVFKVGDEPEKQVFVLGKDDGGNVVGVKTMVVET